MDLFNEKKLELINRRIRYLNNRLDELNLLYKQQKRNYESLVDTLKDITESKGEIMLNIQKKLEKRINTIVSLTTEYPKQIKISEAEYKELQQDLQTDNITSFRNCKLIINK